MILQADTAMAVITETHLTEDVENQFPIYGSKCFEIIKKPDIRKGLVYRSAT